MCSHFNLKVKIMKNSFHEVCNKSEWCKAAIVLSSRNKLLKNLTAKVAVVTAKATVYNKE